MSINSFDYLTEKIQKKNNDTKVSLEPISLAECTGWKYSEESGSIQRADGSFFSITGCEYKKNSGVIEQPIIIQDEIGFLGIIRKEFAGEMHYLMQYKIEPGNINKIQISPTVQATKSNFTQKHGGRIPSYLEFFMDCDKYRIVADQIQSEQSSRFWGKRNRNIIIELGENDEIEVLPSHDWFTLPQIKKMMRSDNIINMDSRTVLSCLPVYNEKGSALQNIFKESSMINSVLYGEPETAIPRIYNYINRFKVFSEDSRRKVPLMSMKKWHLTDDGFICDDPFSFSIIFCSIEIEGREVRRWCQPLFKASGKALFGLFTCVDSNIRKFLVKCTSEIGCFDKMEIGPCVQREPVLTEPENDIDILFRRKLENGEGVVFDTMLSEEGGRFYHEQNRNAIIEIGKDEVELQDGYFWCDYKTLNMLVQVNNTLNIQLRNLLSVMEF